MYAVRDNMNSMGKGLLEKLLVSELIKIPFALY
jgi:hypothetical protein